jgi:ferredoxin
MGKGASYIRQAIQLANQWLQSCGEALFGDQRVTMQENCHDPKESRRRVLISAERPIVSRRDFLFGFARSSGPVELAVKKLPFESANENQENKSGPHIPTWLHRLAQIYPQTGRGLNRANDEHLYSWPTFSVGENCAACQACSVNCPSGALLTKVVDGDYLHLFTPGFCVGCGLCAKVCPAGALSRSYAIDRKPFEQRTISGRRVDPCTKCGQSALHGSGRLCFCCAAEPPVSTVLDSARQFLIHR